MPENRRETPREHLDRVLDEASRPEEDRTTRERNVAIAVGALALLVVVLLVLIVMGGTGAYR
jgi:hypothetical protein